MCSVYDLASSVVAQAKPLESGAHVQPVAEPPRWPRLGWTHAGLAVLYLASVGLLLASRVREFADESDNLLGGLLIARGERLYVDYFSSHMPFAYYLAAVPALFGAVHLEQFRPFTDGLLVLATLGTVWLFRHRLPLELLGAWAVLVVYAHVLQFGEMLTAGTCAGFGCLLAGLLFYTTPGLRFSVRQAIGLAAAVGVAVQSELLALYPLAVLAVAFVWAHWRRPLRIFELGAIVLAPHLLVLLGFALSGALSAMLYDAAQFNQAYYSQFVMSASPVQMLHDWEAQYRTYLHLSLADPLGIQGGLVLGNLAAAGLAWARRGPLVGLAVYAFGALSHVRTEDGYYLVSYASLALVGTWAVGVLAHARRCRTRAGALALLGALLSLALLGNWLVRVGREYDLSGRPARTAAEVPIILALTQPGERIFVAPYDPYLYLATDRMPAARLPFYFPWQAVDPRSRGELLADLRANRPPVIVFRQAEAVNDRWVAGEYGRPLLDALAADYAPLDPTAPVLQDVLVPRERLAAARQRLAELGLGAPVGRDGPVGRLVDRG